MSKTAFIFPGQGSQYLGMGSDFSFSDPESHRLYRHADEILGFSLSKISFEGPDEELKQTRFTQPAIFLHSIAVFKKLNRQPDMVAGHSLGEYSALVAAGAISFEDGLTLVGLRGSLMQQAGEINKGTMAAIVGLLPDTVEQVCGEASSEGVVQPANYNAPGQIVISGSIAGVRKAMELAKARGAKLVKELVVSGAFHSPLMAAASDGLKNKLNETTILDTTIPVYANVTAEPVTKGEEIRDLLFRQLTHPVRWEESVIHMVRDGATSFVEAGPGKILQGLVKRIAGNAQLAGYDKLADIH